MENKKVLVAGATGYLGGFVVKELKQQGYRVRALCRTTQNAEALKPHADEVFVGEVTRPETLTGVCENVDVVFSSLGITKQKDGLTYMDVDYQGNRYLLDHALVENVSQFLYVSVLNADTIRHLEIVKAKERFVEELKAADIDHVIVRPTGFFSDMTEFFNMARKGRVWLFGDGSYRSNPIHGGDLARACVSNLESSTDEFDIGGPEVLTHKEIATMAFEILGRKPRISYPRPFVGKWTLGLMRAFTPVKTYGPVEFFTTVLSMDMVAPTYGQHSLRDHFTEISAVS